jgi:rhodanese-related sulfurtransferase
VCGAGFDSVHNVTGGMGAWEAEGLPVNGKVKPPGGH